MRRIRKARQRKKHPQHATLPSGTRCFNVTAHPVGGVPLTIGCDTTLGSVVKLGAPMYGVDHVGETMDGRWLAFNLKKEAQ